MFTAINLKKMFTSIFIVELIGAVALIIAGSAAFRMWREIITPDLAASINILIIIWVVLFAMCGVAVYFVQSSKNKKGILNWFWIQMFFMVIWPILFFNLRAFGFSAIWLIILIALIAVTIKKFSCASRGAGYLLIPYLLFYIYLLYLNYGTWMLN